MASWLANLIQYADLSEGTLRATHAALRISGLFRRQREAIAHELAMRAWAEAVEARLERKACVWCERGGVS